MDTHQIQIIVDHTIYFDQRKNSDVPDIIGAFSNHDSFHIIGKIFINNVRILNQNALQDQAKHIKHVKKNIEELKNWVEEGKHLVW